MSSRSRAPGGVGVAATLGCVALVYASGLALAAPGVDEAMAHLDEGRNAEAQVAFEALLAERGAHADLYYDLGLAFERQGKLPQALLAFERSLALDPRQDDALEHVDWARDRLQRDLLEASTDRSLTQGEPSRLVWWRFFHGMGSFWPPLVLLVAWTMTFAMLLVRRFVQHAAARDTLAVVAALSLIVSGMVMGILVGQHQTDDVRPAIVLDEEPRLAESPTELAATSEQADLYPGATVLVLAEQDTWVQVELADGTRGWLARDAAAEVRRGRAP